MAIERKPSLIRQRFERVQQVRAFNKSVNEVNNELEKSNFGGNITNFNKIYNDIKNQNPQVAARLKYNPQTIKNEVNNRIKQLEKELKEVQEKENRADERNIKDKEKQYRAEQRGLREGLSRLKKGELIKVSDVLRYADQLGDNARNKQRAKEKAELKTTKTQFKNPVKNSTTRVIVDEARFLNSVSDKYMNLQGRERINYMNELKENYGNDVFNAVNQVADLKIKSTNFNINDVDKIAKELEKRNANKTVGDTATFKLTVNALLENQKNSLIKGDFKKLPLTATTTQFNNELKRLNEFNKNIKQKISEPITLKNFKAGEIQNIRNKALTGQTMTPSERNIYLADIGQRNKKLTQQQINNTKKILLSPVNYVESLFIRSQNGERNPLFNDLKNFTKGVGQGLKEIFVDPLQDSFNYGRNLVKRAEKGNTQAIKILNEDIKKLTKGIKDTGKFVKKDPIAAGIIVGAAVGQGFKATNKAFKENPAQTLGLAVAYLFPGTVLKTPGKVLTQANRLSPNFRILKNGVIKLGGDSKLKKIWNSSSDFLSGKLKVKFPKFKKNPEIILKKQSVSSGAKPLSEQAKLAGAEVTAVNTAANQITGWIKRKVIVRKPIKGEDKFPKAIKDILSEFDKGTKLTKEQFAKVNKWLQKNVAPNITLLERSLFADPESGFRMSRLGIEKARTATLKDFFKGDFKLFDTQRPQVLIFQNAKIAKFPKRLKKIENKLKTGKKLTESETNDLIAWQIESGKGKFKPVGSTIYQGGRELEITLPPGDFVKRIKKIGTTIIQGKKVDFVTAEVFTPPKSLANKIKKAKQGKLTKAQVEALEKELSKKLGTKTRVETPNLSKFDRRSLRQDIPILRLKTNRLRVVAASKIRKATTPRKTSTPRKATTPRKITTPRKATTPRKITTPRKVTPPRKITTPRKVTPPRKITTPRKVTPPRKITTPRKVTTPRVPRIKKPQLDFNKKPPKGFRYKVDGFASIGRKKVKVVSGLPENKAFNKVFNTGSKKFRSVDNSTAQSFEFRIVGLTKAKDDKTKKGISKVTKSKGSTKTVLKLKEKSKARIDTKGEKKGLKLRRKTKKR